MIRGPIPTAPAYQTHDSFFPLAVGIITIAYYWIRYLREESDKRPPLWVGVWVTLVAGIFISYGVAEFMRR